MLRDLVAAIIACLLVASLGSYHHASSDSSRETPRREVSVTFDDLPVVGTRDIAAQQEITKKLLHSITSHKVPAIGFVNENKLLDGGVEDERRVTLLQQWLDAGLDLGNHSFSHPDLHTTPLETFQADVVRGEAVTRRLLDRTKENPALLPPSVPSRGPRSGNPKTTGRISCQPRVPSGTCYHRQFGLDFCQCLHEGCRQG